MDPPTDMPALGQIVVYHHPPTFRNPAFESPAIVQAVRSAEGVVRLFVFAQGGAELVDDVWPGEAPGQWSRLPAVAPPWGPLEIVPLS